jgi:hypothetical protein
MSKFSLFSCESGYFNTPKHHTVEGGIRLLSCHTSDCTLVLSNDNRLYLRERGPDLAIEEDPPLASGEVVCSIQTGYNYRVLVTGFLKKKPLRLHPNWKLDDITVFCLH